jgi:NCS1 family nucleobase:cation symporter-1
MAFLVGFFISAAVFYGLNVIFPVADMDQMDAVDVYGTFTPTEAHRIGVAPLEENPSILGITSDLREEKAMDEKGV